MKIIIFLILCFSSLFAINIDGTTNKYIVTPHSFYYLDSTNKKTINNIQAESFISTKKESLSFGFLKESLWIKIKLKNNTNKTINKILEYDNALTEDIKFYFDGKVKQDGMYNIGSRETIHPYIALNFKANEEKTIYINAKCTTATLIAKLVLWDEKAFYKYDFNHKLILFILMFGVFIILLYNLMLLVFTKDKTYLYYNVYLICILILQGNYNGIAPLYFQSQELTIFLSNIMIVVIALMGTSITQFTRIFLDTKKFPKLDRILKYYMIFLPLSSLLVVYNWLLDLNIIVLYLPLVVLVIFTAFYALFNGIRQAKFYVLGWSIVLFALVIINMKSVGLLEFSKYFTYINEFAYLVEALLFSIALAHRINILSQEKQRNKDLLIEYQQKEQERLTSLVESKTKDLRDSLEEKALLYNELNHRVKNNLQMIISLIKLQMNSSNSNLSEQLNITKNRIHSISKLYELLHLDNKQNRYDLKDYFHAIANSIKDDSDKNIEVKLDISENISFDKLVYCGLILNELLTNAYKYAYEKEGLIEVNLFIKNGKYLFIVKDYGKGFSYKESLGLTIVNTLVKKQLLGEIKFINNNGLEVKIKWDK